MLESGAHLLRVELSRYHVVMVWNGILQVDPGFNREITKVQIVIVGDLDGRDSFREAESLRDFAWAKRGPVEQCAVVAPDDIVGVSIPGPPSHHARRGRCADCLLGPCWTP